MRTHKGEGHGRWKGGRLKKRDGYIIRHINTFDANEQALLKPMVHEMGKGALYVMEHRAIVALNLGHPLKRWEIVHHINGDRADNRLGNLQLHPLNAEHLAHTIAQNLEAKKWQRAFYRATAMWLRERERAYQA